MPILPRFHALVLTSALTAIFCRVSAQDHSPVSCQEGWASGGASVSQSLSPFHPGQSDGVPEVDSERSAISAALHHNDIMNFSENACPDVRLERTKGLVIIYLYQDKRARPLDLKIDTVIAARVIGKLQLDWVRGVEVHYFKDHDQSRFVMAAIDMASVQDFATGAMAQEHLLSRVIIEQARLPGLKESYHGLSYRQILTGARVTASPARDSISGRPMRLVLTDSDKVE